MPRFSQVSLQEVVIGDNYVPLVPHDRNINFKELYVHVPSDLLLSWNGDLVFDHETMDYKVADHLIAWVQRLYLMLITQKGTNPEAPNFGWDFEYLIDLSDFEATKLLPQVIRDVKDALESDPDTLKVEDIVASVVRKDNQTSYIKLDIYVKPKNFSDIVQLSLKIE